jgi:uncharacterized protein involved in exopolysaccharide biosynthesis
MIARHVIARLLETFFRRWWLYLIPVVALLGVGVFTAGRKADTYRSSAVLTASDQTLLDELQNVSRSDVLAFESPADATVRRINEALSTDEFIRLVRAGAGVPDDSLIVTIDDVRRDVWASSGGQNVLRVNASTLDPQLAQRLVQATIDEFIKSVINNQISESTTTVDYLKEQQQRYEEEYDEATAALLDYLRVHPAPFDDSDRPVEEDFEIERLRSAVTRADERLSSTLDDIQAAQLRIEQATSDATQTVAVVDPPSLPVAPETGLRAVVMTVATFGVLGMLLLLGSVVAASLLDRTLRYPEEIRSSLGVEVLAVVPIDSRSKGRRRRKAFA